MGNRLFHVDVFPGLAGPDGSEGVPVVAGGDDDGVDVIVFEKFAHVGAARLHRGGLS